MKITISGKNIDVTEGLRGAVEDKLKKLEKYFTPETVCNVTLSVTLQTVSGVKYFSSFASLSSTAARSPSVTSMFFPLIVIFINYHLL